MDVPSGLKTEIGWNRFCMRTVGIWPDPEKSRKENGLSKFIVLLPIMAMIGFINIPQTAALITNWGDLEKTVDIMLKAELPVATSFLKLFVVWLNKESLRPILASVVEDWTTSRSATEKKVMLKNAIIARKLSIRTFVLLITTVIFYFSLHSFLEARRRLGHESSFPQRLPFHSGYPFDEKKSPNYELAFLSQLIGIIYAVFAHLSVDNFVAILVLHLCAQLSSLRLSLKKLFMKDEEKDSGSEKFREGLRTFVLRHEHLNRFAGTIEDIFNKTFVVQILVCSLEVCFQAFQFLVNLASGHTESIVTQSIFLAIYTSSVLLNFFAYCYVGEMLNAESIGLRDSLYESDWYNLSPKDAKLLILVMMRASTPLEFTAGKFQAFSLELFCKILKSSMGYLSMLIAVRERLVES